MPDIPLLGGTSGAQAEPHHCHDQATNKQWEQIMWNHRGRRMLKPCTPSVSGYAIKSMLAPSACGRPRISLRLSGSG
jgi:hypothetical protein